MEKKTKNTVGNRNGNPTPQGSNWPDETIIRYITRALVLLDCVCMGAGKP